MSSHIFVLLHIHFLVLSILFQSHLTRPLCTQGSFKNTQSTLEYSRKLESTRTLGLFEGTGTLGGHSEGTVALGHLRYFGTWTLTAHSSEALVHFGNRDTLFSRFCHLWRSLHHTVRYSKGCGPYQGKCIKCCVHPIKICIFLKHCVPFEGHFFILCNPTFRLH